MNASRLQIELYLQDIADSMARDGLGVDAIVMGLQEEFMDEFDGPGNSVDDWMPFIQKAAKNAGDAGNLDEFSLGGMMCPSMPESIQISRKRLQQIILEEIDESDRITLNYDRAEDVEPLEDVWSGGENITFPLLHSDATKETVREPESLADADPVLHKESAQSLQVYMTLKDRGFTHKLPSVVFEQYYDAYVEDSLDKARKILESHLDKRHPLWLDYEWK